MKRNNKYSKQKQKELMEQYNDLLKIERELRNEYERQLKVLQECRASIYQRWRDAGGYIE